MRTNREPHSLLSMIHVSGWIIFKFENEVDREHVLVNGPYATFGTPWMLKHMPLDFTFDDNYFTSVPTWIKLPNLPLEVWNPDALSQITSYVGMPLGTDQCTKTKSQHDYARVLVEVDTTKPLVHEVTFQMPRSKKWITQPVTYESEPKFCMKCRRLGHGSDTCTGKKGPMRGRSQSRAVKVPNVEQNEATVLKTAVVTPKTAVNTVQQPENGENHLLTAVMPQKTAVNSVQQAPNEDIPLMTMVTPNTAAILKTIAKNNRGKSKQETHATVGSMEPTDEEPSDTEIAALLQQLPQPLPHIPAGISRALEHKTLDAQLTTISSTRRQLVQALLKDVAKAKQLQATTLDLTSLDWPSLQERKSRRDDEAPSTKPRRRSKSATKRKPQGQEGQE